MDMDKELMQIYKSLIEQRGYVLPNELSMKGLLIINKSVFPLELQINICGTPYFVWSVAEEKLILLSVDICEKKFDTTGLEKQRSELIDNLISQFSIWDTQQKLKMAKERNYDVLIKLWEKDFGQHQFKKEMIKYLETNDLDAMRLEISKMKTFLDIDLLITRLKIVHEQIIHYETNFVQVRKIQLIKNQTYKEKNISLIWIPLVQ
jgi:hypothetical protein